MVSRSLYICQVQFGFVLRPWKMLISLNDRINNNSSSWPGARPCHFTCIKLFELHKKSREVGIIAITVKNDVKHSFCIHNPVFTIWVSNHTYPMLDNEKERLSNKNLKHRIYRISWQGRSALPRYKQSSQQAASERTRLRAKRGRQYAEPRLLHCGLFPSLLCKWPFAGFTSLIRRSQVSKQV